LSDIDGNIDVKRWFERLPLQTFQLSHDCEKKKKRGRLIYLPISKKKKKQTKKRKKK